MNLNYQIRRATENDLNDCLKLVQELAVYEKAPNAVDLSIDVFKTDFKEKKFNAYVAYDFATQSVLGMALFYSVYSTWKGNSIHLEDLVVEKEYKRRGIGKSLFEAVLKTAKEKNAGRLQFEVLNWNEPAIAFYKKYPCDFDSEWINVKISKTELQKL